MLIIKKIVVRIILTFRTNKCTLVYIILRKGTMTVTIEMTMTKEITIKMTIGIVVVVVIVISRTFIAVDFLYVHTMQNRLTKT